jgi:hypothetical protein
MPLRRKETGIRELLDLVRQTDKVDRHPRTSRLNGEAEENPDRALAMGVKTCRSNGADCIRKEFASCDHESLDSLS